MHPATKKCILALRHVIYLATLQMRVGNMSPSYFVAHLRVARLSLEVYRIELLHIAAGRVHIKTGLLWDQARDHLSNLGASDEDIQVANNRFASGYISASLGEPIVKLTSFLEVSMIQLPEGLDNLLSLDW